MKISAYPLRYSQSYDTLLYVTDVATFDIRWMTSSKSGVLIVWEYRINDNASESRLVNFL